MRHTQSMNQKHALSTAAALIADPARAAMLVELLGGRALTAGELARAADVSAQSASQHLGKLVDGGMLVVQPEGRHRYYRMAGPEVGFVLEALGVIATTRPAGRVARTPRDEALCFARTCYDHLAGRIGVELTAVLERTGILIPAGSHDYSLGPDAPTWLASRGIDIDSLRQRRRPIARRCLDWTERRPHVGGVLGARLLAAFIERAWVQRRRDTRAVRITDRGIRALEELGVVGMRSRPWADLKVGPYSRHAS
jgi:DNA-binding transcriptional ArsR family regulator